MILCLPIETAGDGLSVDGVAIPVDFDDGEVVAVDVYSNGSQPSVGDPCGFEKVGGNMDLPAFCVFDKAIVESLAVIFEGWVPFLGKLAPQLTVSKTGKDGRVTIGKTQVVEFYVFAAVQCIGETQAQADRSIIGNGGLAGLVP